MMTISAITVAVVSGIYYLWYDEYSSYTAHDALQPHPLWPKAVSDIVYYKKCIIALKL